MDGLKEEEAKRRGDTGLKATNSFVKPCFELPCNNQVVNNEMKSMMYLCY